ncbi:MAG: hydrogenase maturation protease [Phycisphaerales bacterium]|nr:hydrogenase maturation protease [Phycisphaerales bacterium]
MIVQWLRESVGEGIQLLDAHQLLPELADPVSRAHRVIFIDASVTVAPGRVKFRHIHAKMPSNPSVGHNVSPELILTLVEALYGHAPPATVIAIGASSLELGEGLTPQVERTARRLVKHLTYWLTR